LKFLFKCFPFDLAGDCDVPPAKDGIKISCIINFYGRLDLLRGVLYSLAQQDFLRDEFEVILVEDRGGTDDGRKLAVGFADRLQIRYSPLDKDFGLMGCSRNYGLSLSRGGYILFLDDDTAILQKDFLQILFDSFTRNGEADAIVPHGMASYAVIDGRYDYHAPYFMTSRCTAYRRSVLQELAGFMSDFVGQEDVEFVVRFLLAGKRSRNLSEIEYFHPPLLVSNLGKPMAVGHSFFKLRARYPFVVWLLVLVNCCRHIPLYIIPGRKYREMGRFGIGFFMGVVSGLWRKTEFKYN